MLSILIPVFNWDVVDLVFDLRTQCRQTGVIFEIRCLDDGSNAGFRRRNAALRAMPGVVYRESPRNLGPARARNSLIAEARHDYVLMLDCDIALASEDYIKRYLACLRPNMVLCGGRVYGAHSPQDPHLYLHWLYGRRREQSTARKRNRSPHHAFITGNFLAPKRVFEQVLFDVTLSTYGHDDTLFGLLLRQAGWPVLHLDNPVEHLGLTPADRFLRKVEESLDSLISLGERYPFFETKLTRVAARAEWLGLGGALARSAGFFRQRLRSRRPALFWLQAYKLARLLDMRASANRIIR
jgi:glycosyltransferase involved in cell wall biosynthesis